MMRARIENATSEASTAEDYENAAREIEELKKPAEEDPNSEKVLSQCLRIAQSSGKGVAMVIAGLSDLFTPGCPQMLITSHQAFDKTREKFWDVAKRLREAEKQGERYDRRKCSLQVRGDMFFVAHALSSL